MNNTKRLLSLDTFRGATIAAMVLVNDPGSVDHAYAQLRHAAWHGWTMTDMIFPFFLFIVGVAMTLSFANRQSQGQSWWGLAGHALVRAFLLCLVGFVLDGRMQFMRVLQQIAIGYLIVFPFVPLGPWVQGIVALFLLAGHTAAYHIHATPLGIDPWLHPASRPGDFQNFGNVRGGLYQFHVP